MHSSQPQCCSVGKGSLYEVIKRAMDITGALAGILLLWPLLVIIAIAVKSTSRGPIIYRGIRTGRFGKQFSIFKFRSMFIGSDSGAGTTSRRDPRVTAVGRFIRRYKLDELPQLVNVFVGDMSLVGPRPELPRYADQYQGEERLILQVRPGITDYSSIEFANLTDLIGDADPDRDFEERVLKEKNRLRVKYVKERNLGLDLRLLFATLMRILKIR